VLAVRSEPEPDKGVEDEDPFEALRREIPDFAEYDEAALDEYRAFSFYFAQRRDGETRQRAKELTCERFGHDAPRGLCRRCGIGVELGKDDDRDLKRAAERQRWLASRFG
jgi:hypothetical protein